MLRSEEVEREHERAYWTRIGLTIGCLLNGLFITGLFYWAMTM